MHLILQLFSLRFIFEQLSNLLLMSRASLDKLKLGCGKAWKLSRIAVPKRGLEQHPETLKNTFVHQFKPC